MEKPRASVTSEEGTPDTTPENENYSEATMDQPQTSTESADPSASGCESATRAESENQLRLFVSLLTVRVFTKCNALKNRSQEESVSHIKLLVDKTMEGLTVAEGFCPDVKSTKKVCKAVLKVLQKKFCSRRLLEIVILLQDPDVDAVIAQSLQKHVKDRSARLAKKAPPHSFWKDALQAVALIAGFLGTLFLMVLIV